jgi:phage terminase small subunit
MRVQPYGPSPRMTVAFSPWEPMMRRLTLKQQRFVEQYLILGSAVEAARRAGYSARSAQRIACNLMKLPHVADAVRRGNAARAAKAEVTAERVLAELGRIARWGPEGVTLREEAELGPEDKAAIAEIAAPKGEGSARVKLHDKQRALDSLAKHLQLYGWHAKKLAPSSEAASPSARAILRERLARLREADDDAAR